MDGEIALGSEIAFSVESCSWFKAGISKKKKTRGCIYDDGSSEKGLIRRPDAKIQHEWEG